MKTYDFSTWTGFPLTREVMAEVQRFYSAILNGMLASLAGTEPVLIAGCEILSGALATGATVSDGVAYHPDYGFMTVEGGLAYDDSGFVLVDNVNSLTFEGNVPHNAEFEKKISIDNMAGNSEFPALMERKWTKLLRVQIDREWTVIKNDADGYVRYSIDDANKVCFVEGWSRHYTNYSGGNPMNMLICSGLPAPDVISHVPFATSLKVHLQPDVLAAEGNI